MATRTVALKRGTAPPRWVRRTAWAAFAVTVPSALWRVLMIVGLMPGTAALRQFELGANHAAGYAYVFGLSLVQLAASFMTVGLVRPWGTAFRGRRVPLIPVVIVATLGGLAVTWLFTFSMTSQVLSGHRPDGNHVFGIPLAVMIACYAPILAWGPLELATTYGYWQHRRARLSTPWGTKSRTGAAGA